MSYQNPPPHPGDDTAPAAPRISQRTAKVSVRAVWVALLYPHDDTAPAAPRISRRTAKVLGLLVRVAWSFLIIYLTISVFAPWFAGLLT
ncbi:hypothetical protein [Candidatus Poriferisocius sp.]|uniref:hypothetical protein n=1 Tax=Candidatus Poriferisocius sp. TaxID=3101276 RepID=UPI003B5C9FC8